MDKLKLFAAACSAAKLKVLLLRLRRAEIARLRFQVFKPVVDTRYSQNEVASHNKSRFPAVNVAKAEDIYSHVEPYTQVIGIDEAQFFDHKIVEVAAKLAESGRHVIVAGLDTDWRGEPFGPMPQLLAVADIIHKQYAICVVCGAPATRTSGRSARRSSFYWAPLTRMKLVAANTLTQN